MVKTKRLAWLLGFAAAGALAWYFLWSAVTPKGQPPLTRLSDEQAFVKAFNRASSDVRMVLLFSPT